MPWKLIVFSVLAVFLLANGTLKLLAVRRAGRGSRDRILNLLDGWESIAWGGSFGLLISAGLLPPDIRIFIPMAIAWLCTVAVAVALRVMQWRIKRATRLATDASARVTAQVGSHGDG